SRPEPGRSGRGARRPGGWGVGLACAAHGFGVDLELRLNTAVDEPRDLVDAAVEHGADHVAATLAKDLDGPGGHGPLDAASGAGRLGGARGRGAGGGGGAPTPRPPPPGGGGGRPLGPPGGGALPESPP